MAPKRKADEQDPGKSKTRTSKAKKPEETPGKYFQYFLDLNKIGTTVYKKNQIVSSRLNVCLEPK